jgi:hypothetical protein
MTAAPPHDAGAFSAEVDTGSAKKKRQTHESRPRVFAMPAVLAVATIFGLLAALLGHGAWHVLAWIALSAPIAVALWHIARAA